MHKSILSTVWFENRFVLLLTTLLLLMLVGPFLDIQALGLSPFVREMIWKIIFSIVLLSGAFSVIHNRNLAFIALGLGITTIIAQASSLASHHPAAIAAEHITGMVFMLFNITVILYLMFTSAKVTLNIIAASLCVYLLLAFFWAQMYSFVEFIQPGSFSYDIESGHGFLMSNSVVPIYFSLVTMSTLGYGDVLPLSESTRMMASTEAIIGQLYIAVLVARLIGLHTSSKHSN